MHWTGPNLQLQRNVTSTWPLGCHRMISDVSAHPSIFDMPRRTNPRSGGLTGPAQSLYPGQKNVWSIDTSPWVSWHTNRLQTLNLWVQGPLIYAARRFWASSCCSDHRFTKI